MKCEKCKKVTTKNSPTGLLREFRVWIDKNETHHKDISKEKKVCLSCSHNHGEKS